MCLTKKREGSRRAAGEEGRLCANQKASNLPERRTRRSQKGKGKKGGQVDVSFSLKGIQGRGKNHGRRNSANRGGGPENNRENYLRETTSPRKKKCNQQRGGI